MKNNLLPEPAHYHLACPLCGGSFNDSSAGFLLSCPEPHPPALLRAVYRERRFTPHPECLGVFRYRDWLPVKRVLDDAPSSVVYHATGLGHALGLENLFVIWNGWWPEKGGLMKTGTFKELEAQAVCGRVAAGVEETLVVSSAGNTARSFHDACTRYGVRALLVVPMQSLPLLWTAGTDGSDVRLAVLDGGADYADVIELGGRIAAVEGYYPEGGARNVARRDGMGTALLAAVEKIGVVPDHYFQAVGSGTGAIAAWEMNLRLLEDARFGGRKMKLHLSQNEPFTPMADAWELKSRSLNTQPDAYERSRLMYAPVLSNRNPPYMVMGGLYDALLDTNGEMYRVTNEEARDAGRLFEKLEGNDIDPAAEVCIASLCRAAALGRLGARDVVAVNVTGGGQRRFRKETATRTLRPDATFSMLNMHQDVVLGELARYKGERS